ncbi:MAG: prolyl oligopeptidase family serine peptidase, partial [Bacteroidales bacterium]
RAAALKGKLLIITGGADDNVHPQNTYEFTEALVQNDIPFDMHVYTNRNHFIEGGNTSLHLYRKMADYLKANL